MAQAPTKHLSSLVGAFLFIVLATANAAGYRYGVSDQAFYIPAILDDLQPALFPHDTALIESQARLMLVDEALAGTMRATGVSMEWLFAAGYVVSLLLIWAAALMAADSLYAGRWAAVALVAAVTLRHRITRTSANSFEAYFHPRMLAFGICALAVAAVLRRRPWNAIALVAVAAMVHVTTALWFAGLIGVALAVVNRRLRPWLVAAAGLAVPVAAWAVTSGPLSGSLGQIDGPWRQVLATKDSLFANEWPAAAWIANLGTAGAWAWAYIVRRRHGVATEVDAGLLAGGGALLALFFMTLPAVAAGVVLFVELQISRVFWPIDFLATIYVISAIELAGARRGAIRWVATALVIASIARGTYILQVERAERSLAALHLERSPWTEAMRWLAAQPVDTHVLADPAHAWKYGTSVRVAAARDVFLEEVKDSAVAIYSRDVGLRVLERTRAIGDFTRLTAARARELDATYDLDYLVTEARLDLPVAYRNARFIIYSLR